MDTELDYTNIGMALEYYKSIGYTFVDVPWRAPVKIQHLTFPSLPGDDNDLKMVGSAEQSFLWLDLEGKLPKGKFVACTPCYRKEINCDNLHRQYFMKVELYQNKDVDIINMKAMIADSFYVMQNILNSKNIFWEDFNTLEIVKTSEGFDINLNKIEVGSYGIRTVDNSHKWIYGTGLAEPRFSSAAQN